MFVLAFVLVIVLPFQVLSGLIWSGVVLSVLLALSVSTCLLFPSLLFAGIICVSLLFSFLTVTSLTFPSLLLSSLISKGHLFYFILLSSPRFSSLNGPSLHVYDLAFSCFILPSHNFCRRIYFDVVLTSLRWLRMFLYPIICFGIVLCHVVLLCLVFMSVRLYCVLSYRV